MSAALCLRFRCFSRALTLIMMILCGGGSQTGAQQPKWEIVHALEGIGLRETVHEASGWDAVTVSAQQEFAAACDAAGRVRIFRILMYPNLYPRWPMLQYGQVWSTGYAYPALHPGDDAVAASCSMSEDASLVLWQGRLRSGALSVRLLTRGTRSDQGERRQALDGCDARKQADELVGASSWDSSGFQILHPRDPYADVWGYTDMAPAQSRGRASDAEVIASTIVGAAGEWVALLRADGSLRFIATKCWPPAGHPDGGAGRSAGGTTRRGTEWQELAPLAESGSGGFLRCEAASLVASGCASKTVLILPGRDCALPRRMQGGAPSSGGAGRVLGRACLSAAGEWGWCQGAFLSAAADALACSLDVQIVPMHRLPAADMPGVLAPGGVGRRPVLRQHWQAPACDAADWRSILVVQACGDEEGGGGGNVHVMLLSHEPVTHGNGSSSSSGPLPAAQLAAGAGAARPHTLSLHLLQTIAVGAEGGGRARPLALDVSGRLLAIAGGDCAHGRGEAEGGGGGGRAVQVMEWDGLGLQYREADDDAAGELCLAADAATGRPAVQGLAILTLKHPYILAALGRQGPLHANSAAASSAPTLVAATSSHVQLPAHHPFARQESFYITPPCVFPIDRACAQPVLDFHQEWSGLPATQSSMLLLPSLLFALYLLHGSAHTHSTSRPAASRAPRAWCAAAGERLRCAGDWARCHQRLLLNMACAAVGCLSVVEIVFQDAFVNDWPAHLHHAEQFREGRLDYNAYMHYHGHNAYPAAFLYTYTSLLALTGGSIRAFQLIWAAVEVASLRAIGETAIQLELGPLAACLAAASNRLHLYHVRVVTNDGLNVALMLAAVRLLAAGRPVAASALYSLTLAQKLNFITYLPAWLWALARSRASLWESRVSLLGGALAILAVQIAAGLPFLAGNTWAYLRGAYNLGRGLLWDKSRVFKFVGRESFASAPLHVLLLLLTAASLGLLLYKSDKRWRKARDLGASCVGARGSSGAAAGGGAADVLMDHVPCGEASSRRRAALGASLPGAEGMELSQKQKREMLFALLASNQLVVGWARALYTPFLAWNLYALPLVLALAGVDKVEMVATFVGIEVLFRPWGSDATEAWVCLILLAVNVRIAYHCVMCHG